jgi:hypothetical protein
MGGSIVEMAGEEFRLDLGLTHARSSIEPELVRSPQPDRGRDDRRHGVTMAGVLNVSTPDDFAGRCEATPRRG